MTVVVTPSAGAPPAAREDPGSDAPDEPPAPACPPDARRVRWSLQPDTDGARPGVLLDPPPEMGELPGEILWEGDLNADRRPDRIVDLHACGNWAECVVGVYVDCGDGTHAVVLEPDYLYQLSVSDTRRRVAGRAWRDLVELQRGGSAIDDSLHEVTLRFDGVAYQRRPETRRLIQRLP